MVTHSIKDKGMHRNEALFINKYKPQLNSKDEYKSRMLKLKF